MSRPINLMPESYRIRLGDHRLRGRYGILYAGVLAIAFVLGATNHARVREKERELASLSQEAARLDGIRGEIEVINLQADEIQNEIAEYQRLELTARVSAVLSIVASQMPDRAQLKQLRLWVVEETPPKPGSRGVNQATATESQDEHPLANLQRTLKGEMTGIALRGIDVSAFFDRLYQHPLFARVQTNYSRIKTVDELDVHEFSISFEIDLNVRYVAVAAKGKDGDP